MKKILFVAAAAVMTFASCGNKTEGNNNGADSAADSTVYAGVLPAADGSDSVTITLKADSTFTRTHSGSETETGKYSVDAENILTTVAGADSNFYAMTPDSLTMLGADKQPAASGLPYVLKKVAK
ncbi:hypothetical protein HMPREF9332_01487 [Alloprevotella rava F0323]|uniref:Lipocalin-like domain-containing protein n=1 Tax=Alloprevotella rava F0323 TaxID=679199 RepID=G5GD58_9BACT|nr:copper resistance protein NlpE N-terminal domain-containing protein [Alloprevotella rava]EHG21972.1 hypothetical protein HMPREF9332_01487 [Alloprevotella rava F0323]